MKSWQLFPLTFPFSPLSFSALVLPWNDLQCHYQWPVAPFVLGYIHAEQGSFHGQWGVFPWTGPLAQCGHWHGPPGLLPLTIAPQNPAVRLLRWTGGFWWHRASVLTCQILPSINAKASSLAWDTFLAVRHSFSLSRPLSCRFGARDALSLGSLHKVTQIQRLKTALEIERDLSRL